MAVPQQRVPEPSPRPRRHRDGDLSLTVFLVLLLASTVMSLPLREVGAEKALVALRLATLAVGVAAIARQRALAGLAFVAALVTAFAERRGDVPLLLASRVVFFALAAAALLARVFGPGRITVHRILGGVAVYVLLAVIWGNAYGLVAVLRPDAIRAGGGVASLDDAMWLSFITITTTGYGDVLPASALARGLAALEALVGVLYPAVLISRLVSLAPSKTA